MFFKFFMSQSEFLIEGILPALEAKQPVSLVVFHFGSNMLIIKKSSDM